MWRHIHNLCVIRHDKFSQPLRDLHRQPRLKIQEQFIREAVDIEIRLELALVCGDGRVAAVAGLQILDVVRDLAV